MKKKKKKKKKGKKEKKVINNKFDFLNDSFSIPKEKIIYNEDNNILNKKGANSVTQSCIQSFLTPTPTFSTSTSKNFLSKSLSPIPDTKNKKRRRSLFDKTNNLIQNKEIKNINRRVQFKKSLVEIINVQSYKKYNLDATIPEKRKEKSYCKCVIA